MKVIYLTEEAKADLESLLTKYKEQTFPPPEGALLAIIFMLEKFLEHSVVLPVEESWEDVRNHKIECPSGVIIQPKQ
jgi:hypothetical protein